VLVSTHPKAKELAKTMFGFKEMFLVGFFLTIGLAGELSLLTVAIGIALVPLMIIKTVLFIKILTRMHLRSRTSLLATLNLSNYSEFGLIVMAVGVTNGWLDAQWLIVMAIALSISLIAAAPLNSSADHLYRKYHDYWRSLQSDERLSEDERLDTQDATIAIFGMGRVGAGAYDELTQAEGKKVIGVDINNQLVDQQVKAGRNVIIGNPADPDFWERIEHNPKFELILLAMPNLQANKSALDQLKSMNHPAELAAVVRYPDEEEMLREEGVKEVFNIYFEAGAGFAEHVVQHLEADPTKSLS